MDGSATVILKERLAFKSSDVADAASVNTAVEKQILVTVRMPVRTDRMSRRRFSLNSKSVSTPARMTER